MKRLFAVTVEYEVMVYAEDTSSAESVAEESLRDIAWNETPSIYAWTPGATEERRYAGSIPYGDELDRTVRQLLRADAGSKP